MSGIDRKKLSKHLLRDVKTVLLALGYDGVVKNGEFVTGDIRGNPGSSCSINLKSGLFIDRNPAERGAKGKGVVDLIAKARGIKHDKAARLIIAEMGWEVEVFRTEESKSSSNSGEPILPIPDDAPAIPWKIGDPLRKDGEIILANIFEYFDQDGRLLNCILRFEGPSERDAKAKKEIRPLYFFGPPSNWRLKVPRSLLTLPLYGLEQLAERPEATVLIVEGEKTALAARDLFPELVVITWQGGVGRIGKADWGPLLGRVVFYWPDADEAGRDSISNIQYELASVGAESLSVVDVSHGLPAKWDLADESPEGFDLHERLFAAAPLDLLALKRLVDLEYYELPEGWVFIVETEEFHHLATGLTLSKLSFDGLYRHLPEVKRGSSASAQFLEDFKERKLIRRIYLPGSKEKIVLLKGGLTGLNTWVDSDISPVAGDARLFVQHLHYLAGNDKDFNHLADMLAYIIQKPGRKLKSAIIIVGKQGTGKSYVGDVLRVLVGAHNCSVIETHELKSEYSAYMEDKVLVLIEEMMAIGRRDVLNNLKPKITQSTVTLRKKYANSRDIPNTVNFIAFTNHMDALPLDDDDRRYFVVGTDLPKKEGDYYDRLWSWTEENYGAILSWLLKRDLSRFNPNARPPVTAAKREMTHSSRPIVETEIARMIAEHERPFDQDLVVVRNVLSVLTVYLREANLTAVQKGLKANGAKNLGQKKALVQGLEEKVSLWAIRNHDQWERKPNAAIARAYLESQARLDLDGDCDDLLEKD